MAFQLGQGVLAAVGITMTEPEVVSGAELYRGRAAGGLALKEQSAARYSYYPKLPI